MLNKENLKRYLELARVSKITYAGPIRHDLFSYKNQPFVRQRIVHGLNGRGFCRILWNANNVVIAFRGTRDGADWEVSNLRFYPSPLRNCPDAKNIRVHRGFQDTLDFDDKTTKLRSLDAIEYHLQENNLLNREMAITGHSLGGALAILFAIKFKSLHADLSDRNLSEIVTFGAPAVGLAKFKKYYGPLEERTIRIVNRSDGVPFTPPFFYHHVGQEIWLNRKEAMRDVGWPARLYYALFCNVSSLSADHDMKAYILSLENEIKTAESFCTNR